VNKLGDGVSVDQSDNLKSIPRSEMWNLIVSNPPHFIDQYEGDIRTHDPNWQIHRNFFETVSAFCCGRMHSPVSLHSSPGPNSAFGGGEPPR
jgi:hypothetical protein